MKHILILIFVLFTRLISYSQMSLPSLQNFLNLDLTKFETYCLNNNFYFKKSFDDDNYFGVQYKKGSSSNIKYLTLYEKFSQDGKTIVYQTHNTTEYLSIKSQIENSGYLLVKSYGHDNSLVKIYENKKFRLFIFSDKDEVGDNRFEISISFKN